MLIWGLAIGGGYSSDRMDPETDHRGASNHDGHAHLTFPTGPSRTPDSEASIRRLGSKAQPITDRLNAIIAPCGQFD